MTVSHSFLALVDKPLFFFVINKMKTTSLVKRLKWSFSGNMNPHALVIGDVDNDDVNSFHQNI